jgi:hypothetical protein
MKKRKGQVPGSKNKKVDAEDDVEVQDGGRIEGENGDRKTELMGGEWDGDDGDWV